MSQPEFETHISELREDSKPGDGLIELKHEENQVTQVNTRNYPNVLRYSLERIFLSSLSKIIFGLKLLALNIRKYVSIGLALFYTYSSIKNSFF